jgi:hypothetical protein
MIMLSRPPAIVSHDSIDLLSLHKNAQERANGLGLRVRSMVFALPFTLVVLNQPSTHRTRTTLLSFAETTKSLQPQ